MSKLDEFKKALSTFFENNNTYYEDKFVINPTDDINSEKYNFTIVDRFDVDTHQDLFRGIEFQMTIKMLDDNPFSKISFIPPDGDEANMPPAPPASSNNMPPAPPAPPFRGGIRSAPPPILKNLSCKVISPVEIDIISDNDGFNNEDIYNALKKLHDEYELERKRLAEQLAKQITERLAREKAEKERLAREKEEADRLAREKEEADRLAREKAEKDRLAIIEANRIEAENKENERLAKIEADRIAAENAKAEEDRLAREKTERERQLAEANKIAAEKENLVKENAIKEKLAIKIQAAIRGNIARKNIAKTKKPDPELDNLDDKRWVKSDKPEEVKASPTEELVGGVNVKAIIADEDGKKFMNFVQEFRVDKLQEIIDKKKKNEIDNKKKELTRLGMSDTEEIKNKKTEKNNVIKNEIDEINKKYEIKENSDIIGLFDTLPENEQDDILKSLNKALLYGGKCGTSLTYMCSLKEFVKSNKKLNDYLIPLCSKDDKLDYFLTEGTIDQRKEKIRIHTQAVNLLYDILEKSTKQEGKKGGKKTRRKYKKQTNHKKSRKSLFQQKRLNSQNHIRS